MKIEEGRYYKTRDGRKVGPMEYEDSGDDQPWTDGMRYYCEDGKWSNSETEKDLISEWQEGPIREVRRREIVPGVYGDVKVNIYDGTRLDIFLEKRFMNAEQLREAAHLFNQLAEVLEEQEGEGK